MTYQVELAPIWWYMKTPGFCGKESGLRISRAGEPAHGLMPSLSFLESEDSRVLREKGQQRFVIDNDYPFNERRWVGYD